MGVGIDDKVRRLSEAAAKETLASDAVRGVLAGLKFKNGKFALKSSAESDTASVAEADLKPVLMALGEKAGMTSAEVTGAADSKLLMPALRGP